MLGARNISQIDELYTRGTHEDLSVFHVSLMYFGLPRQSIRNYSYRLILFKQTLGDVRSVYYDIGAYDMFHSEVKEICHEPWIERFNCLCFDMA